MTQINLKPKIMKTTLFSTLLATAISATALAQDVTTVNAASAEISDNLDLRAVASIFGDAANLEDFERKLNDPEMQISNLDLNNDSRVDYIRVIESVEGNTHLIVLQSVLGRDVYQDVATIEVERDARNNVQIQVVGDVYMYGPNYIYEPVYVHHPVIYNTFWVGSYHPYASVWYWNYYPTYYYAWNPYPVFRYRRNVHVHINAHNHYNYVNVRRSDRAVALYNTRRSDGYARQYPNRSFQQRHTNVANRYELDQKRNIKNVGTRNSLAANTPRNNGTRNNATDTPIRNSGAIRTENNAATRNNDIRNNGSVRTENNAPVRNNGAIRTENNASTRNNDIRNNSSVRTESNAPVRNSGAIRTESNANTRIPSAQSQRTEANPVRQNRAEQAPRANRAETAPARGNSGRSSQMAANKQSAERRSSETRR